MRSLPSLALSIAKTLRVGSVLAIAGLIGAFASAQSTRPVISLEPAPASQADLQELGINGKPLPPVPANFRRFPDARAGELADVQTLTLRFADSTKLNTIASTADFRVEQGSSCVEGNVYPAKATCTLLVRFTPQGPGHRLGRITIEHSGSTVPFSLGLGGNGYAPVISFTPAVISTVPGTYPAAKGLLSGALNLTVDGGDTLYIADTGNNLIRFIDSSGAIASLGSPTAPVGLAVDSFGEVFYSEPASNAIFEIYSYGPQVQASGTGTGPCTVAAPCVLASEAVASPGQMSIDPNDQLFFANSASGAAEAIVHPEPTTFANLLDPFTYQELYPDAFAVDVYDNLYSFWGLSSVCQVSLQTFSAAANSQNSWKKVAGGRTCGFSGDGGQARNAEISAKVSQIAFDAAGNLYFTDTNNQRVRRIDNTTGIITTIAGTGAAGYNGDGGAATLSALSSPTGVSVDSQGQVYIISGAAATGTAQVVRKLGPNGALPFSSQLKGTASAGRTITLANTGNTTLSFTNVAITGGNPTDFAIDPLTTSCLLTPGSSLYAGSSCKVGVIFKPTAGGTRTANLVFLAHTVTNSNTVSLFGPATLPPAVVTITSPASSASFKSGTAVPFTVTVATTSGPAPTGTVTFSVDGAAKGTVTLASGSATLSLTGLSIAGHTLSAVYNGDANYAATGPVTRTITVTAAVKAATKVTLSAVTSQTSACKAPSFKVSVANTSATTHIPSGTVQLKDGAKVLATATLANGSATLGVLSLSPGTHTLVAVYSGDSLHAAADSSPIRLTIAHAAPCLNPIATPVHVIHRPAN